MVRFGLNTSKANNYAFFCPVSRLHLTRSNPIGSADGVTPAILRGLKSKAILDLDNVVDLTTGTLKTGQNMPQDPPPQMPPQGEEPNGQDDTPKRGGRGRRKNAVNDNDNTGAFMSSEEDTGAAE